VGAIEWPTDTVLACIIRGDRPLTPSIDDTLETGDELLFVTGRDASMSDLRDLLVGPAADSDGRDDDDARNGLIDNRGIVTSMRAGTATP
jgi:NhaP-type Na+/H+ and K+/H+ antiporter